MRHLQTIFALVVLMGASAVGLATRDAYRPAFLLIALSIGLLAWSLERIRDELAHREIKK